MAFVKLDAGILNSTIWVQRPDLEIFITALLLAQPVEFTEPVNTLKVGSLERDSFVVPPGWYGFVHAAGPGIVHRAHIDPEVGIAALERLAMPEPESRSQDHEGRRLVRVNGGFVVLNFMRYRDRDHTAAERQRRLRERRRKQKCVTRDSHGDTRDDTLPLRNITHSREQRAESRDHTDLSIEETIYQAYPKKTGKQAALKAIRRVLEKYPVWREMMLGKVQEYATAVAKWSSEDLQYVPDPATWFNKGKYEDDPKTWERQSNAKHRTSSSRGFENQQDYSGVTDK